MKIIRNVFILSPTIKDNFDASIEILRQIRSPVVPCFDQFEEGLAGALRSDELPVSVDLVVRNEFLKPKAFVHE